MTANNPSMNVVTLFLESHRDYTCLQLLLLELAALRPDIRQDE